MKKLNLTPFTHDQLALLAMGKARGYSWEEMARQTQLPLAVVERVAWTHEKVWNRYLTKAERNVARETLTEVASVLRRDVDQAEVNVRPTLVNSLTRVLQLQQEIALAAIPPRRERSTPLPAPTPPPTPTPSPTPPVVATPPIPGPMVPPNDNGPPLKTILASVLLFVLTCFTLLSGGLRTERAPTRDANVACVNHAIAERTIVALEQVAPCLLPPRVVQTPPPWIREGPVAVTL